jgi:enediyne biosynthesis protein E4
VTRSVTRIVTRPLWRRTALVASLAALASAALAASCGRHDAPAEPPASSNASPAFTDVTAASAIHFVHENGASGHKYLVETNGSGVAWLDFDRDGDLDLYLVQGAPLPGYAGPRPLKDALLRNDHGKFVDVTAEAGVGDERHGMAAAAPDYDNDGDPDLFVTNFGRNTLYQNDGHGRFTDVTEAAGLGGCERYHSSCCFADFDGDGDLDLYVCGYVDFRIDDGKVCGELKRGEKYRSYCHPDMYTATEDELWRNNGDGTFSDVSKAAGVAGLPGLGGKGLGVAAADIDDDRDLDLFVANDSDANFLWRNDGGLRFTNVASPMGVDYNGEGRTSACMGAAFGDADGDGRVDLFTDTLSNQYNILWMRTPDGFVDRSYASGLAGPSIPWVGFGTLLADLDNDGDLDVVVANGHVLDNAELVLAYTTWRQPSQIYWNEGRGHFRVAEPAEAGAYFGERHVGRALAAADFDDDGDLDLLFTNNHEAAHLLRNEVGSRNAWIGFKLVGTRCNRDALGAEVVVRSRSGIQRRLMRTAESYLSFHDLRIVVGLGRDEEPVDVEIRWPGGQVQMQKSLALRRYHELVEPK